MPRSYMSRLPEHFVMCRYLRHAWTFDGVFQGGNGKVVSLSHCRDCHTIREDKLDRRSGDVKGRQYHYPEGYLARGRGAQVRASTVRKEVLRRYKTKNNLDTVLGKLVESQKKGI